MKNKINNKYKSKKVKGNYGSVYSLNPGTIIGPNYKKYLYWPNLSIGTLVLLTAHGYQNDICAVVGQTDDWEGFGSYGTLYKLRDFKEKEEYFTSYDFRVLVIMKSTIDDSNEIFQIGLISGIYINSYQTLHVMILNNSNIKYRLYNSNEIRDNNDFEFISYDDIHKSRSTGHPKKLQYILNDFLYKVIQHPLKNILLSLYRRDDDIYNEWILTNIQNKQDVDNIVQSQTNYNFRNSERTSRSTPPPSGSEYNSRSTPPPSGSEYSSHATPPQSGLEYSSRATPPQSGLEYSSRATPPQSGPQISSPSPSHNDYDIDNIIIKMFFPFAQDLTIENFTNVFDKQKESEAGRIIFSKIMSQNDSKDFRKIYLKTMLKLHPDKQTDNKINNLKKIIKEKGIDVDSEKVKERVNNVYMILNIIKDYKSGGNISLYKKVYSKNILGKKRVIYKARGSNKEYIKRKGAYISVKEYKNSVNK